jgi:exonuclease III
MPARQGQPGAMKLLSWNCRGLGKPSAIRALKKLLQSHQPSIVYLMETKFQQSDFHNKYILVMSILTLALLTVLSLVIIDQGV